MSSSNQTYQVNEIFHSIQGEGSLMGIPSTFIRLQGCRVGCVWCDTKYTWLKGGTRMVVDDIVSQVKYRHVVVTGGEPTMYDLDALLGLLRLDGRYTQLETSGQQWLKGERRPDWITWSPKENLNWDAPDEFYQHAQEIKYVVDDSFTWTILFNRIQKLVDCRSEGPMPGVSLMPEGCPPRKEMVDKTFDLIDKGHVLGWQFRYSDRLQWRIGVK